VDRNSCKLGYRYSIERLGNWTTEILLKY